MRVPPAAVWDALADAGTYDDWVVGSKRIRAADASRMTETPDGLSSVLGLNPLVHLLTMVRNAESLRRLEQIAARRRAG